MALSSNIQRGIYKQGTISSLLHPLCSAQRGFLTIESGPFPPPLSFLFISNVPLLPSESF